MKNNYLILTISLFLFHFQAVKATPLYDAIDRNNKKYVNFLLQSGSNINERGRGGITPLMHSIEQGFFQISSSLIHKGADVRALDDNGETALNRAFYELYNKENEKSEFKKTQKKYCLGIITLLCNKFSDLRKLSDSEQREGFEAIDDNHETVLMRAVNNTDQHMVEYLLRKGANINPEMDSSKSPLLIAIENDNLDMVEFLLKNGADQCINRQYGDYNILQLMLAVQQNSLSMLKLLIDNGADVDLKDSSWGDNTALMAAAYDNKQDIVSFLLAYGAKVNHQDEEGDTALIYAAINGHSAIVRLLLKAGADVSLTNNNNQTAKDIALEEGYVDISTFLGEIEKSKRGVKRKAETKDNTLEHLPKRSKTEK